MQVQCTRRVHGILIICHFWFRVEVCFAPLSGTHAHISKETKMPYIPHITLYATVALGATCLLSVVVAVYMAVRFPAIIKYINGSAGEPDDSSDDLSPDDKIEPPRCLFN